MIQTDYKTNLKPFLKWAGGKSQLLPVIEENLPIEALRNRQIKKYVEPFVGSGAVLFYIISNYPEIKEFFINDINMELINLYKVIKTDVESLISYLEKLEANFIPKDVEDRKIYYYEKRKEFNLLIQKNSPCENINKAALFIFLNRTCFNGLYRVNRKGEFNVPMGQYKNPTICNRELLLDVNKALRNVSINSGSYFECDGFVGNDSFVYFDPPYRPLTQTASFTSYTNNEFTDKDQINLAEFYKELDSKNAYLMLSNSDPHNTNPDDNFFDELYNGYRIKRVNATRRINSKATKRGPIQELLIMNY